MFICCFSNAGSPFRAAPSQSPCCGTQRLNHICPGVGIGEALRVQRETLNSSRPAGIAVGTRCIAPVRSAAELGASSRGSGLQSRIHLLSPLLHQRLSVNLCLFSFFSVALHCLFSAKQPRRQDPNLLGLIHSHRQEHVWGLDRGALFQFFSLALYRFFSSPLDYFILVFAAPL